MNKGIAHVLMQQLLSIPYIQVFGGLVSVQEEATRVGDGIDFPVQTIQKRYPVTGDYCITKSGCGKKGLLSLIPDSSYFGQVYFEDRGIDPIGRVGSLYKFKSKLRMVVWLNSEMIVTKDEFKVLPSFNISTAVFGAIQDKFNALENKRQGYFARLKVRPTSIPVQSNSIFSLYSYDEKATQYLMPPYEFFAVDYEIEFQITPKCMDELTVSVANLDCSCANDEPQPVQYPSLNDLLPYYVTLEVGIDTNTGPVIIPDSNKLKLAEVEILSPIWIGQTYYPKVPLAMDGTAWDFTDLVGNVYEGTIALTVRKKIA